MRDRPISLALPVRDGGKVRADDLGVLALLQTEDLLACLFEFFSGHDDIRVHALNLIDLALYVKRQRGQERKITYRKNTY